MTLSAFNISRNAAPLSEQYRTASFGLAEDNLKGRSGIMAQEVIQAVRDKIAAVNWDHFDPASEAAKDLFPTLVAVADTQEAGREFFRRRTISANEIEKFITGKAYPESGNAVGLFRALKQIAEKAIDRLEERLPKNDATPLIARFN